ncbi:hypothetical protein NliqN6_6662 [Naganishia liquefaciens]|uniref:Aquaporin-like protein n=1 Tax=Naganishia liquefaciens TaxID=104408 RepID=A0A8H3TZV6_9TREE|nr:hypothetical protein NliqN6_6662 [Naganishia liquefaciens]
MTRQKPSILSHNNEKDFQADRDARVGGHHRLAAMREKGPLAWNVRQAEQSPRRLAIKNHFIACVGEYVGTTLFLLLALGATNVANIPTTSVTGATAEGEEGSTVAAVNTSSLLYISLAFGFSLAVNAWIFFRVSGGLFNPAVSLGMALVGALTPLRACLLTVSQILGGMTGAAIVDAISPGTLNVRTQLSGGTSIARGLFIEMFMTAMLMITILLLAAEKHKATFLAPIGIGLALFIAELMSVYYTGGSLNPARSFGPCVVLRQFNGYHYIYWLGPALGATIAAGFYKFIKFLEYETVLGPEADDEAAAAKSRSQGVTNMNQAVPGGANSLTGGAITAPGMLASSGRTATATSVPSGPTMANQGTGLGDLLTHDEPAVSGTHAFDLEANNAFMYNERLDRIETMLGQLLTSVRWVPKEDALDPNSETRRSMAPTLTGDSLATHDKAKLLPAAQPGYPRDSTVYDQTSDVDGSPTSPVALSTPVDMGRLAGHLSDDNVRRL